MVYLLECVEVELMPIPDGFSVGNADVKSAGGAGIAVVATRSVVSSASLALGDGTPDGNGKAGTDGGTKLVGNGGTSGTAGTVGRPASGGMVRVSCMTVLPASSMVATTSTGTVSTLDGSASCRR